MLKILSNCKHLLAFPTTAAMLLPLGTAAAIALSSAAAHAAYELQTFEFKPWSRSHEPDSLGLPWTDGSDQYSYTDGSVPFTYYGTITIGRDYDPGFGWADEADIWDFDLDIYIPSASGSSAWPNRQQFHFSYQYPETSYGDLSSSTPDPIDSAAGFPQEVLHMDYIDVETGTDSSGNPVGYRLSVSLGLGYDLSAVPYALPLNPTLHTLSVVGVCVGQWLEPNCDLPGIMDYVDPNDPGVGLSDPAWQPPYGIVQSSGQTSAIPVPPTLVLLAGSILGFVPFYRRRRQA